MTKVDRTFMGFPDRDRTHSFQHTQQQQQQQRSETRVAVAPDYAEQMAMIRRIRREHAPLLAELAKR